MTHSSLNAIQNIGQLAALPFCAWFCDKYGRRPGLVHGRFARPGFLLLGRHFFDLILLGCARVLGCVHVEMPAFYSERRCGRSLVDGDGRGCHGQIHLAGIRRGPGVRVPRYRARFPARWAGYDCVTYWLIRM